MFCRACARSVVPLLVVLGGGPVAPAFSAEPPEVPVSRPVERAIEDYVEVTGRTEAAEVVEIRPRVAGVLEKVAFEAGAEVKRGDLLFELDGKAQQAALAKAEARLRLAEARLKQARADAQRAQALARTGTITREELDRAEGGLKEAEALLEVGKAEIELARLELSWTKLASPIDGRIGQPLVSAGNLVWGGDGKSTPLATIVSLEPMFVYLDLDEATLLRVYRAARDQKPPGGKVPMRVGLASENGFPRETVIGFVENRVNPDTGTVRVRGKLENRDRALLPGMFVRGRLSVSNTPRKVLLVNEAAVRKSGRSAYVRMVEENRVWERWVVLGRMEKGLRVVEKGLRPGDWVVVGRRDLELGEVVKPRRTEMPRPPKE